jgi:predicted acetyltransferase
MNLEGPRRCNKDELGETLAMLDSIFHSTRLRRMGKYYPYAYGDGNLDNMRIIKINNKIASHAAIYQRFVNTADGLVLKIGCIGGVATLSDYRGKGYATVILKDCIKKMENEDYDISILWTSTPEFYRKLGWEWAGKDYCFHLNSGNAFLLPKYDEKITLETNIKDYSGIKGIYEKKFLRSERKLDDYPLLFNSQRKLFYQRDGKITAYVLISDENGVLEYGGDACAVLSILRRLIEQEIFSSLKVFIAPQDDGLSDYLEKVNFPKSSFYMGMIRIVNHEKFLKKFGKKAVESCPSDKLSKLFFGPEEVSDKVAPLEFYLWQTEHM